DQKSQRELDQPEDPERQELRDDELPAGDGRHVQLLERAELLLARDVLRAEERPYDRHQGHQDAGDHVELVVLGRVIAASRAYLDLRWSRSRVRKDPARTQ